MHSDWIHVVGEGLAFADLLAGVATLTAGAYRINLIDWREEDDQLSRWDCVGTPHFILLTFAFSVQAGMLLLISLDRLIAFLKPLQYNTFTKAYAISLMALCYFLAALYTVMLLLYVLLADGDAKIKSINAICLIVEINEVDKTYDSIYLVRIGLSSISCLIYALVWYLSRKYHLRTTARFPSNAYRLRRSQRHLTATVGICALFTFVLNVLPTGLVVLAGQLHWVMDFWGPVCWLLNCVNAVVNIFVYSLRHEDIRMGLTLLFSGRCKELPSPAMQRLKKESLSLSTCSMTISVQEQRRQRTVSCP
uniref:G-protein coupled receptors family 1 profile domain-containing protein n=1 Tax=Plectus sambesii TaxID=2011161 RepID=A0A914WS42_9BILA